MYRINVDVITDGETVSVTVIKEHDGEVITFQKVIDDSPQDIIDFYNELTEVSE